MEDTRASAAASKRHHTMSDAKPQQPEAIKTGIPAGDLFGKQQPAVNLQDHLRYAGSGGGEETDLLPTGYKGPANASRPRYVESAFWALLHGQVSSSRWECLIVAHVRQEPLCDKFLDAVHGSSKTKAVWNVNAVGLAILLNEIPTQTVCDVLLHSFLVGVCPVHPLIHLPTFRKDYNAFWHCCRHSDISTPDQRLIDDPTFIPLLFSVLYCGAVAAPVSFWSGARPLTGLDKGTIIDQLRNSYIKGLEHCQHTRRPTLNTLVASLLGHGCSKPDDEAFENLSFINMVVRIAQSMGLHREYAPAGLDSVTHEMYRRIWWHVVCLDTQYSFRYGSQTCCGTEGNQWDVQMGSEASDEAILEFQPRFFASVPTTSRIIYVGGS